MKKYKSYKELKGNTLKFIDILHFKVKGKVLEYRAMSSWLNCSNHYNGIIFDELDIKDKYKFCSNSYGYETNNGSFPFYHERDYKAFTRIALDLFKLCDNYKGDKK